jgi:hypothetical protein
VKSEIVYRIYHPSKALVWNSMFHYEPQDGYWSEEDNFVVEFGDSDEEYAKAKEIAGKVGGLVEEVRK